MADILSAGRHRPSEVGRTLFDYADELAVDVPASCEQTGRCRECVVAIVAGEAGLSEPSAAEEFLLHRYRLACQARIIRNDIEIEFASVRRPLRILVPDEEIAPILDPAVTVSGGVVCYDGEQIGPVHGRVLGLAIDLGTTTIVFEVIDLIDGTRVASGALENPQQFGGSDVVTRIAYEQVHPGLLRRAVRRALNRELRRAYAAAGIDRHEVFEVLLVGNTTMRDLFFGLDVDPIGRWPFRSVTERAMRSGETSGTGIVRLGHEVGLFVNPRARVVGGPIIASHVGADAAADLVAADLLAASEPFLLVDIGTNTEVIAGVGGRFVAASCPAGPAFEGGFVNHGMSAAEGAIESVAVVEGVLRWRTIGDAPPEGICGSGLVDVLAELLRVGQMTPAGRFAGEVESISIVPEASIGISRLDVSHLAQAKSANLVGQQVLLRTLGLEPDDLVHVFLAGGFAHHLDIHNAIEIGLLVPVPEERVRRIGNASMRGARRLLLSLQLRAQLANVIAGIGHVQLEQEADFFELFVEGCTFGRVADSAQAEVI